jgi:hypothetical protein
MRRAVRENALCALVAAAASAAMAWLGLYGFAWNDYENEAKPALDALTHGHVLEFLRLAPAYGGSLVERAPFALLPGLWGGGALAVYRTMAVPCLLAGAALGVWLCARMRASGRPTLARAVALGVCVANPLTLRALELGHPEELLGACLCIAAVMLAARDRPIWAGVALGLAIANKEWAVLAAGPVLLALGPRTADPNQIVAAKVRAGVSVARRRVACAASAVAVSVAALAPLALAAPGGFAASTRGAAVAHNAIFQPWQAWWFLGGHGGLVHGLFGAPKPGYRTAPMWTNAISHPLIVMVGLGLAGAVWLQCRRRTGKGTASERDALLTLALILLMRCVLDTWDTAYYALPFVLGLLAWEALGQSTRPPVLALASTVLAWLSFQWLPTHGAAPDTQAAVFLAWTLPLAIGLALRLYAPGVSRRVVAGAARRTPGVRAATDIGAPAGSQTA